MNQINTKLQLLSLLGLILVLQSCGQNLKQDQMSSKGTLKLFHDLEDPINGDAFIQWEKSSIEDYNNVVAPFIGLDSKGFVEPNNEMVLKAQKWVNEIHQTWFPEGTTIPIPQVRVYLSKKVNAFVAGIPICTEILLEKEDEPAGLFDVPNDPALIGLSPEYFYKNTSVLFDIKAGKALMWPTSLPCKKSSKDSFEVAKSIAKKFNSEHTTCKLKARKVGEGSRSVRLALSKGCPANVILEGSYKNPNVVYFSAASFITLYSQIFERMTEKEMVAVLAHELAHYYKSHSIASTEKYDFYYKLGEKNSGHRPVADKSLEKDGSTAFNSSVFLQSFESYKKVNGQVLMSAVFPYANSLFETAQLNMKLNSKELPEVCNEFNTFNNDKTKKDLLLGFPFLTADSQTYKSWEEKLLKCFLKLPLELEKEWKNIEITLKNPIIKKGDVSETNMSKVKLFGKYLTMLKPYLKNTASYYELLGVFDSFLRGLKRESITHLQKMAKFGLGQYTVEQEADEMAAESLSKIGLDPKNSIDAFFALGKGKKEGMYGFIVGMDKCRELYQNQWQDQNGENILMSIGDYSEIHHSLCFRIFNLDRELKAHQYEVTPNSSLGMSASWEELRKLAQANYAEFSKKNQKKEKGEEKSVKKDSSLDLIPREYFIQKNCIYSH